MIFEVLTPCPRGKKHAWWWLWFKEPPLGDGICFCGADIIGIYGKDIIIVTVFCGVGDCICFCGGDVIGIYGRDIIIMTVFCGGDIVDINRRDVIDIVDTGGWNVGIVGGTGLDGGNGNGTQMDR